MLELVDLGKKISKERYREVFPQLETDLGAAQRAARAAGVPVVATAVDGIVEVVQHGVNGFLAEPGDVAAMAREVCRLLGAPELRQRMGANSREGLQEFCATARMSISWAKSQPTTRHTPAPANARAKSPVPHAMSRTSSSLRVPANSTAFRRQYVSRPALNSVLISS